MWSCDVIDQVSTTRQIAPVPSCRPMPTALSRSRMRELMLLAVAVPVAAVLNIPFILPKAPSLRASGVDNAQPTTLKLRKALHVGSSKHPGLLQKDYTEEDRSDIDTLVLASSHLPAPAAEIEEALGGPVYTTSHVLKSKKKKIWRPRATFDEWSEERKRGYLRSRAARGSLNATVRLQDMGRDAAKTMDWDGIEVEVPDVQDLETLRALAMMTSNAYNKPGSGTDWYDLDHWNISDSFGWDEDGIRGHVYTSDDNATVVISLKGTSAGLFGFGGSTGGNDKVNDNLLFSCCCARVDWTWSPVCDCFSSAYTCRQPCLEDSLITKSVYFPLATSLYNNATVMYPDANIWLVGHSLGGGLASLLGMTFGVPVVAFESPGDLLAARRLHLPLPPGSSWGEGNEGSEVTHVYHTADPIAMGVCNGPLSLCSIAGFALETSCHVGQTILYDTVTELNWGVDVRTHTIRTVIDHVVKEAWNNQSKVEKPDIPEPGDPYLTSSPVRNSQELRSSDTCALQRVSSQESSRLLKWWPWPGKQREGDEDDSTPCQPNDGDDGSDDEDKNRKPDKDTERNKWIPKLEPSKCEVDDCFRWVFSDDWSNGADQICF